MTISFRFWIQIVFILALKWPKKRIFGSEFWARQQQKCYRNLFLGHFETPKDYGRHCHRYLGNVKFFQVIWIKKRCQKQNFCSGSRVNSRVNLQGTMVTEHPRRWCIKILTIVQFQVQLELEIIN